MAEIRMPAVIDFDFIADMGRMNGELALEDGTGYSQEPTQGLKPWRGP